MASNGFKVKNSVNLDPQAALTLDSKGDLQVDSSTGKVSYHNGTTASPVVTESHTATLSNKTVDNSNTVQVKDTLFEVQDDGDSSKKLKFQVSGVTGTKTLTVPNADTTIVGTDATQTLSNKTLDNTTTANLKDTLLTVQDNSDATKLFNFDAANVPTATTITLGVPPSSSSLLGDTATQTFTNKTIKQGAAAGNFFTDQTDTSARLRFSLSSQSPSTDVIITSAATASRSIALPDADTTLVGTNATQTLTNKTLTGNTAVNLVSGSGTLTLNTTGTITVPNATDTLVGKATTDTLSNKTFSDAITFSEIATPSNPAANKEKVYTKSDGNLYILNSSGIETQIGSGAGGGSKNYLGTVNNSNGNGNFELGSTTGWNKLTVSLSSLIPTGAPTIGTAASVTTFAVNSTTPIAGTYDLQVAGSSGFTAGQGIISDARTIDQADQAKVQTIRFYYKAVTNGTGYNFSGTSANTYAVYIYDTVNSTWIQPTGVYGMTQSSGVGIFTGTFQTTSNMTSFRIAVIAINATTSNTEIRFDDFSVGPETSVIGAAISDWESYTPTGTWTTNTTYSGKKRRVGDSLHLEVDVTLSGSNTDGQLYINLPSGLSIDTSKINTTATGLRNNLGIAQLYEDSGTVSGATVGLVSYDTTTRLSVYTQLLTDTGATGGLELRSVNSATSTPTAFGANDRVSIKAILPIQGWSSNVQMSGSDDGRVVAAKATIITTAPTVTAGVPLEVVFNSSLLDNTGSFSTSTGRFTAPIAGIYKFTYQGLIEMGATAASVITAYILKNGAGAPQSQFYLNDLANSKDYPAISTGVISLNAGDYISVWVTSTTQNVSLPQSGQYNTFSVERLSGPSVIAASESVNASYYSGANQSATTGVNREVNFGTKVYDTHGAVSTGDTTWKFTAPISGKYQVSVNIEFDATTATGVTYQLKLFKNGSQTNILDSDRKETTTNLFWYLQGSTTISLNAGDYIHIKASQATGGALNIDASTDTNITINKVGN